MVDPSLAVTWTGKDGDLVREGTTFGTVQGKARGLLVAERVALNFMQRMSGIATATHWMCQEVKVSSLSMLQRMPAIARPHKSYKKYTMHR